MPESHSLLELHSSPVSLSNLLCEPEPLSLYGSVTWMDLTEQPASFLEEGRNLRDDKQELVSRKEMDSVTGRHFIPCP